MNVIVGDGKSKIFRGVGSLAILARVDVEVLGPKAVNLEAHIFLTVGSQSFLLMSSMGWMRPTHVRGSSVLLKVC